MRTLLLPAIAVLALTLSPVAADAKEAAVKKYKLTSYNKKGKLQNKVEATYPDYKSCLAARKQFLSVNGATGRSAYCD